MDMLPVAGIRTRRIRGRAFAAAIGLVRVVGVRVSVVGLRIGSRGREVVRKGKGALNLWEACGWGARLGES